MKTLRQNLVRGEDGNLLLVKLRLEVDGDLAEVNGLIKSAVEFSESDCSALMAARDKLTMLYNEITVELLTYYDLPPTTSYDSTEVALVINRASRWKTGV